MKYWYETLAVTKRVLRELFRRRRIFIFWCIFPLSILIINSYIISEKGKLTLAKALEFVAPSTLVGVSLFFSCLGGTISIIVTEREQKTLKRLLLSPLSGISYFLGILFAHSLIGITQAVLIYIVATLFGSQFNGSLILSLIIIFFSIVAYVGVGFMLGTQLANRIEDVNAIVATFGIPLLILGGAFFPTYLFPENLLKIAQFNPIYHMTEAMLSVWTKGEGWQQINEHFWFLSIFALIMIAGGWISYQRMLQTERRL